MKRFGALGLAICLILAASGAWALEKPGIMLPDVTLSSPSGQKYRLKDLAQGKVTVVIYWSVSCPICKEQMPAFMDLNRKLTGNPFVMLMVNGDGEAMAPAAQGYAADYQMPGPVLIDAGPDGQAPLAEALDIVATPTVLVFDRTGKLTFAQELRVDIPKLNQAARSAF